MRFLFIPGNNSLSHVAKCLAIREKLISKGHEVLIAITQNNSYFLKNLECDHVILPDIQEIDGAGFPSISWFRDRQRIVECVKAEIDLLKEYKPHRVIGVFRFTLKASARIAGIPFDSLICGCMIPDSQNVLGFADNQIDLEFQRKHINMFFRSAGIKMSYVLSTVGLDEISDIREMFIGDRTFLWDFPEFAPVPQKKGLIHVGPLSWNKWPYDTLDINAVMEGGFPLAVISFGTCTTNTSIIKRMIEILLDLGYKVIVAAGGKKEYVDIMPEEQSLITYLFAPLQKILPYTSLIITHGGQMTVFESLHNKVPVIVMPFQPEQAHNGICLERIGCGRLLVPSKTFVGNSKIYIDALDSMTDDDVKSVITSLVNNTETKRCLSYIKNVLDRYQGPETMANFLEQ